MALARAVLEAIGSPTPRIAPPRPARSSVKAWHAIAVECGITPMPWQDTAGTYIEALGIGDRWLYPEVGIVAARQNGKTELLVAHIVRRLLMGRRIMHTAQNRELPREVFGRVADLMMAKHYELLKRAPRFANGQEEIRLTNGGHYRIVAPTRGGARGPSNDDLIVDELRELTEHDFMAAAGPTLMASPNPQVLYLSNAGEDDSVVLNSIRLRAQEDPSLAYLEWSAAPDRPVDDRTGWLEANPAVGHLPMVMENLEKSYRSHSLAGTLAIFETENLCRWVTTMRERLVDDFSWIRCKAEALEEPHRPVMAISLSPDGRRASAALAWQRIDGEVSLRLLFNVTGEPIDTDRLGTDLRDTARKAGVTRIAFDPLTDKQLVKYFPKAEPVGGGLFAQATAQFVNIVTAGKLHWTDADAVSDDLTWTARKKNDERGTFEAVRASDDHPITAALATIRAIWLASGPRRSGSLRVQ